MKKIAVLLTLFAVIASKAIAGVSVVAYFSCATFNIPNKDPYLETYISIFGNTVKYHKNSSGKFQAELEVSMLFLQNDSIKASQKYILTSPEIADTSAKSVVNFVDVKRISLKQGLYKFELVIADKNNKTRPFVDKEDIVLSFPSAKINLSDIELVESYSKAVTQSPITRNGFDIVPYCTSFFPANLPKIAFYTEAYNAKTIFGDSSKFVFNYYIQVNETKKQLAKYNKFSTQHSNPVNILLAEFNIADLPSGNYNLVVEVRDKSNQLIASQMRFFQRFNPNAKFDPQDISNVAVVGTFVAKLNDHDSLADYIRSVRPIASEAEKIFIDEQVKTATVEIMQQYFFSFWSNRNSLDPEGVWVAYHRDVLKVNKMFGTTAFKGYNSDRGRVYLQYGEPDSRNITENEPTTFPYEIWQYYRIPLQNQTNRKFIFMNEELAGNNYKLIHSDARGEIYDANWQMRLNKRTIQSNNMDMTKPGTNNFGNNVDDNFNMPK